MEISRYLAMTSIEMDVFSEVEGHFPAYMACHFSPYGTGLSNIPNSLPENAMLILNDRTPIHGHDPEVITAQLLQALEQLRFKSVLLDFQRRDQTETQRLCRHLIQALPCPIGVSEFYAKGLDCPVFLSPAPLDQSLGEYLDGWQGRELWLDMALDSACITVTEGGSTTTPLPFSPVPEDAFVEEVLHCLYRAEVTSDKIRFYLWRNLPQLESLLEEAQSLGVTKAIGLYQQLCADK